MKSKRLVIYTDGGSRGNPGPAGIGVVIFDSRKKKLKECYKYLGETTNNNAEYNALICGLEEAKNLGADEVVVKLDSELVAKQLNGEYRVKNSDIKPLFEKAVAALKDFKSFEIQHIDREKNKEADKLANKAINLSGLFI
ncbi:MAG: ribonuclease HI family protein [Candidatus Omnitrophica bacterium]|nr:ribonuclease HI family protein [Candidatus Omnitrophota bacterium]MDD5436863.1 ribonuclease HI family protein [Candidatus Omnitrophota bacterium]